jgi:hypothetical protein
MEYTNRRIVKMPKLLISAKVWKIQVKLLPKFSWQGDEPGKFINIISIYQVLN